jgi:hypothetical protein
MNILDKFSPMVDLLNKKYNSIIGIGEVKKFHDQGGEITKWHKAQLT